MTANTDNLYRQRLLKELELGPDNGMVICRDGYEGEIRPDLVDTRYYSIARALKKEGVLTSESTELGIGRFKLAKGNEK